ncbi:MAG TPA: LTA synthase family protein, partial [Candidatus Binatia bacterium]|nr:LTA synthase family protein [Candidatus Binatia bacterium]
MLIRFSILILLYSTARVLFFASNPRLHDASLADLAVAFLAGFRADVVAIVLTNTILLLLAALRRYVTGAWYEKFLNVVFLVCNLPFLIINVVDLEYFKFTGERSNLSLWDVRSDVPFQLGNFIVYYWHLALLAAAFIFLASFFLPNGSAHYRFSSRRKRLWITCAALLLCLFLLGGERALERPVLPRTAAATNPALRQLAQNSTLTLLRSQISCAARTSGGYSTTSIKENEKLTMKAVDESVTHSRRMGAGENVVIIIVESLSSEYTGIDGKSPDYAPFLTQLAEKNLSFANHFANARRSIDALPSIFLGLPHLMPTTFRCAQSRRFQGMPSILREHGYRTLFFHGGRNGAGDFDRFAEQTGFAQYFGADEYGRADDSDGIWGIYDEQFLQFSARQLAMQPEPFAAVIFTLSTHQPFKIPRQYEGRLPKGTLPIHESVGYLDHSLRNFFAAAERMPWFKRTLFVITGDHTGPTTTPRSRLIDAYRVPLIFYHPSLSLPLINANKITQHSDIPASILDHLGVES